MESAKDVVLLGWAERRAGGAGRAMWHTGVVVAIALVALEGCDWGKTTTGQDHTFGHPTAAGKVDVYPCGGHVLVDGHVPEGRDSIFVAAVGEGRAELSRRSHIARCTKDGRFAFSTYADSDGLPEGKYVIVIARFKERQGTRAGISGEDEFKNRYNDAAVNARKSEFVIDHKAPGSRGYVFDLQIKGKPVAAKPTEDVFSELRPAG